MIIPAPVPLGDVPTMALAAPFGPIARELLDAAAAANRAPVILHQLAGEKLRQDRGPRELREETLAALESANWNKPWGLGGVCATTEDAAHFATAGFTWFTLDLTAHLEPRAGTMSLDELDASIIALEDTGAFQPGWHEPYLNGTANLRGSNDEETLARAAVRFGLALVEAEQLAQSIRTNSTGRGDLPDLEITIASAPHPIPPAEFAFLCAEAIRRGIIHNGVTRFAPAYAGWHEPGGVAPTELPSVLADLRRFLPPSAMLSLPDALAQIADSDHFHRDATDQSRLLALREIATQNPALFREWLLAACNEFPTAKSRHQVSTTEDDVRFLPEIPDQELPTTFLDTTQGRQLLLATWDDVVDQFVARVTTRRG
jgi:hypothetical protein